MPDIDEDLLNKVQQLTEENKILKEEVLFWHFFYSESIRLFGDKKEELKPMLKKIMRLIGRDCRAQAKSKLDSKKNIKINSPFNIDAFHTDCDTKAKKAYSKKYPPSIHLEYLGLIEYGKALAIDQQDNIGFEQKINALKILQKKYNVTTKLSSFVKSLERQGVTSLPSKRTVEDME